MGSAGPVSSSAIPHTVLEDKAHDSYLVVYSKQDVDRSNKGKITELKEAIQGVFWDKINNHVEELLDTYENDPKTPNKSAVSKKVGSKTKKSEKPKISCRRMNYSTPGSRQEAKGSTRSEARCQQRKSMLEISSPEIDDNLISIFRRDMHCTDACVIRVVDKSGIYRQSHINRTIPMVCIDRNLLHDSICRLKPATYLRIIRMQNDSSISVFQSSDVFAKRSVIKGGDILRTLAVYEVREKIDFEEAQLMDKETRKVMYNKFTNMQRLDRGVGSRIKWQFMEKHSIEETDTIESLEEKANVSFSIFGSDGFLSYESRKYRMKHVSMIKDGAGLYYFIPQKMLRAFGSQWNRRFKPDKFYTKENEKNKPSSGPEKPEVGPAGYYNKYGRLGKMAEKEGPVNEIPVGSLEPYDGKITLFSIHEDLDNIVKRCKLTTAKTDDSTLHPGDGMSWKDIRDRKSQIFVKKPAAEQPPASADDPVVGKSSKDPGESQVTKPASKVPPPPQKPPVSTSSSSSSNSSKSGSSAGSSAPPLAPRPILPSPQPRPILATTQPRPIPATTQPRPIPATTQPRPIPPSPPRVTTASLSPGYMVSVPTDAPSAVRIIPTKRAPSPSAVRIIPTKRAPSAESAAQSSRKKPAGSPTKSTISFLTKNQILAEGEVLLTTKDHIIFRIPRNADVIVREKTDKKSSGNKDLI